VGVVFFWRQSWS